MKLTLREKLGLSSVTSEDSLIDACNKHALIYENLINSSSDEMVKKLATTKLDDLIKSAKEEGIVIEKSTIFNDKQTISYSLSSIETILAKNNGGLTQSQVSEIYNHLSKMPESAKKIYLNATVRFLSEQKSLVTLETFAQSIATAKNMDPNNIVYEKILESCQDEVNKYNQELAVWREKRMSEIDHENKVKITKQVFGVIGKIFLGIGTALLAIFGGIFACLCESIDC